METPEVLLKQAEEELYSALKALQDGDLPLARSSSARAAHRITEAHQARRQSTSPASAGVDNIIKDLTRTD